MTNKIKVKPSKKAKKISGEDKEVIDNFVPQEPLNDNGSNFGRTVVLIAAIVAAVAGGISYFKDQDTIDQLQVDNKMYSEQAMDIAAQAKACYDQLTAAKIQFVPVPEDQLPSHNNINQQ